MQFNENASIHAQGRYKVECLTPRPEAIDEFLPLWNERLRVIEGRARTERALESVLSSPAPIEPTGLKALLPWLRHRAAERIQQRLTALNTLQAIVHEGDERIAALNEQMRPLQYVRFSEEFNNLVTTVGKNDILDKYLKGAAYTQTLRMGLCGTGTKAAGDTQASHAGWSEVGGTNAPAYTGNRPSITMGNAAAGVSTSPSQAFAITSSGTVAGCFMNNGGSATKDDTTGVLFSAGDFSGGSQAVANLDTLNVVYTLTAT